MNITKRVLASLEMTYAVCPIQFAGKTHFLGATESHGKCLLFSPPDWKASVVWDGPGGAMSLAPFPGRDRAFLAIQEFFPIFQADNAGIVYVEASKSLTEAWNVRRVIDLPFVHRFEIVSVGSIPYIVAASLCAKKTCQDDWSKPGTVYAGPLPQDPSGRWSLEPILPGISKNHGMHTAQFNGRQAVLIAGHEGIFHIQVPAESGKEWHCERLIDHEVSDVFAIDVDRDGAPEIMTIEPFHGDTFNLYKRVSGNWQVVFSMPIVFGHVVWGGSILGTPAILVGSRGGDKDLSLIRTTLTDPLKWERLVIDKGIAPTQVGVVHQENKCQIISANHGAGEVVLYELTPGPGVDN
jgi:hypothetical protein